MFQWTKLGKIFDPTLWRRNEWMQEFAQAPATLVMHDRVRVYFSCRPPMDKEGRYVSYTSFLELDRSNLLKIVNVASEPILELGQRGTFDEFGVYPFSVIEHEEKILGYYGGWTRCESVPFNVAIGMAISKDGGSKFTRLGQGPILEYSSQEPFILSGPKIRRFNNKFYLFYIAGKKWKGEGGRPEPVYTIRAATSDDGIRWTKLNRELVEVRIEDDECQASPDVIFANGRFHMFFCYRRSIDYRGRSGGYRIGYAYSTDLLTWHRQDDKAGIDVSDEGWDSEMISYPHVFELDGRVYMLYLGNQVGRFGFGVARLEGVLH